MSFKGKIQAWATPVLALFMLNSWTAVAGDLPIGQSRPEHLAALQKEYERAVTEAYATDDTETFREKMALAIALELRIAAFQPPALASETQYLPEGTTPEKLVEAVNTKRVENETGALERIEPTALKVPVLPEVKQVCDGKGENSPIKTMLSSSAETSGSKSHSGGTSDEKTNPLEANCKEVTELTTSAKILNTPLAGVPDNTAPQRGAQPNTPPAAKPGEGDKKDEKKDETAKKEDDVDDGNGTSKLEDDLRRRLEDLDKQQALERLRDAEDAKRLQDQLAKNQGGEDAGGASGGGASSGAGGGGESSGGSSSGGSGKGGEGKGDRGRGLRDLVDNANKRDNNLSNLINRLGNNDKDDDSGDKKDSKNERNGSGSEGKSLFDFVSNDKDKKEKAKDDEDFLNKKENPLAANTDPQPQAQPKPEVERSPIKKAIQNIASALGLGGGAGGGGTGGFGGGANPFGGLSNFGNPSSSGGPGGAIGAFPVLAGGGGGGFSGGGGKYTIPNISPGFGSGPGGGGGDGEVEDEGPPEGAYADGEGLEVFASSGGSGPSSYSGAYLGEIGSGGLSSAWLLNAIPRALGGDNVCSLEKAPGICSHPRVKALKGLQFRGIDPDSAI